MKYIRIIFLTLLFIMAFKVQAFAKPQVQAMVKGNINKGETIEILINITDIQNFYAGSVSYLQPSDVMKVKSIKAGELISNNDMNKMEFQGRLEPILDRLDYQFTCTGEALGFNGSGTFVVITAEILDNKPFQIYSKAFSPTVNNDFNLRLQLVQRTKDNNIKELDYDFIGYKYDHKAGGSTVKDMDKSQETKNTESNDRVFPDVSQGRDPSKGTDTDNSSAIEEKHQEEKTVVEPKEKVAAGKEQKEEREFSKASINIILSTIIATMVLGIFILYKNKRK